jgi:GNAT superfamily N-acetyltransferase
MSVNQEFLDNLVVRPIGPEIDLQSFCCNDTIDWYLKQEARRHHTKRVAAVHCFMHEEVLAGYVTTSMTEVVLDESPLRTLYELTEILFRKGGGHKKRFPALLIGMLGVCAQFKRRGLGEQMVKYAIGQALGAASAVACRFVVVDSDATDEAMGLYRKCGFSAPEGQKRTDTVRMLHDLRMRP